MIHTKQFYNAKKLVNWFNRNNDFELISVAGRSYLSDELTFTAFFRTN